MNALEDWISRLLEQDTGEVDYKYTTNYGGAARQEMDALLGVVDNIYVVADVETNLLQKLHLKIRGLPCEEHIWNAIVFHVAGYLPTSIAHDLIDRDIAVTHLGHTRQHEEIQWRLASLEEASWRVLFRDFYTIPNYSVKRFQELLHLHPKNMWFINYWSDWERRRDVIGQDIEREKEIALLQWAGEHPERPDDFPTAADYPRITADRERRDLEEKQQVEAEQLRIEHEAEMRRQELERIATTALPEAEILLILSSQNPDSLLALASNPVIEVRWVEKLTNCHHVKGARQIREAVRVNVLMRA